MSRLIDADDRIEFIKNAYCPECDNYNGVRCRACPINDMIEAIDQAPTVDLWHYPSKGEFPEINEIVFLYLKGSVYKPGCFMCVSEKNYEWCIDCDRNKEVDRSEVLAWQYIVPPKEEA